MQHNTLRHNSQRVLTIGLALLLGACTTVNPYTGEQRTSNAVRYGAVGGVVCGLIGAAENSRRARNAGLGCGAIGAGIGAYMDAQEAELRQELLGTGVQVQRIGDELHLIMPGNVTFNTNEYTVRGEFMPVLDSVAQVLYKFKDTRLMVTGHTDSTGGTDFNYNLSNRRAQSVSNYLATRGVDQNRLISQGRGPDQPIASNTSEGGRAQNRRVELQIVAMPN